MFNIIEKIKTKFQRNMKKEELTPEEKSLVEEIIENSNCKTDINSDYSINHVTDQLEYTPDLQATPIKVFKKKNRKKSIDYKGKPKIHIDENDVNCEDCCNDCNGDE